MSGVTVTIKRGDDVSQRSFTFAHEARTWLLLSGFNFDENDRHRFTHSYTNAVATIEVKS